MGADREESILPTTNEPLRIERVRHVRKASIEHLVGVHDLILAKRG